MIKDISERKAISGNGQYIRENAVESEQSIKRKYLYKN